MFNRTIQGAAAPVILIDHPAGYEPRRQALVASHKPILFHCGPHFAGLRILEGCVALYEELPNGRRLILDILEPGRLLAGVLVDARYGRAITLTATRIEPVDLGVDKQELDLAMRQMLSRAQAHAMLLDRKTASERVATEVLDLADQFARGPRVPSTNDRTTFTLPLIRADLADWLGLTLETVSRRLNAFTQPEIITIRERQALEAIAAGHQSAAYAA